MPQTAASRSPFLTFLAPVVNVPRELWKRLVNLTRGVKDITPVEANAYMRDQGAVILDVREQNEYDAGHVPNSIFIPLGQLERRLAELHVHRKQAIVVICHGGKRSATACVQLRNHKFEQPMNIAGGILAWRKAGLPVEI